MHRALAFALWTIAAAAIAMPKAYVTPTPGASGTAVMVIDVGTNAVLGSIPLQPNQTTPYGLAINPRRPRAYFTDAGGLHIVDTATDTVLTSRSGEGYSELLMSPDGHQLFGFSAGAIDVLDPETGVELSHHAYLPGASVVFPRAAIDPTGRRFAIGLSFTVGMSAAPQGGLVDVDAATFTSTFVPPTWNFFTRSVAATSDRSFGIERTLGPVQPPFPQDKLSALVIRDTTTRRKNFPASQGLANEVAIDPVAGRILVSGRLGRLLVLDLATEATVADLTIGSATADMAVNTSTGLVYVLNDSTYGVHVVDPVSGLVGTIPLAAKPALIVMTPTAPDCDDRSSCTADGFDSTAGICTGTPVNEGAACDDHDACSDSSVCHGGVCSGSTSRCNGGTLCDANVCQPVTGLCAIASVDCEPASWICAKVTCAPATGLCEVVTPQNEGANCDDANVCTTASQCRSGVCAGTASLSCGTDVPGDCVQPACDPITGCYMGAAPDGTICGDHVACTPTSACLGGSCTGDTPDVDGDGICDPLDPCVATGSIGATRLQLTMITLPVGDDRLRFSGRVPVTVPSIDPTSSGIRLHIADAAETAVLDASVPPGLLADGAGWTANADRTRFQFRSDTGVQGIRVVSAKTNSRTPGEWTIKISGRNGSFPVDLTKLPLSLYVDLLATGANGGCATARFPGPQSPRCTTRADRNIYCR